MVPDYFSVCDNAFQDESLNRPKESKIYKHKQQTGKYKYGFFSASPAVA